MIIKITVGKGLSSGRFSEDSSEGGLVRASRTFQDTPGPSTPEVEALPTCLSPWDLHREGGVLHLPFHGHSKLMVS